MLRRILLTASQSDRTRRLVETAPVSQGVVRRFVAGTGHQEIAGETVIVEFSLRRCPIGGATTSPPRTSPSRLAVPCWPSRYQRHR